MMRRLNCTLLFSLVFAFGAQVSFACQVTPSFTYTTTHTCGLPTFVHANNTSTGTANSLAKYWWKLDNGIASDTIPGRDSIIIPIRYTGTHRIRLYVKDTSGCIDSSSQATINVSSNARSIVDQSGIGTLRPVWTNCIQFTTDPDTFRVNFQSSDTLKKLKIFWGDGSSDMAGADLNPNTVKSHLYTSLGIFTVKIVTTNGNCVDTVYGTVYSQRQPTAGIIGPPSGSNRGCVPHTLRIVNNSYNISDNTTFEVDWGIGEKTYLSHTGYDDTLYHTYTAGICSGIIRITATNVCGSSFTTWNPIDISDVDTGRWTVTTSCDPSTPYVFRNAMTDNYCLNPDIKSYYWDFGDGKGGGWTNSKADQLHTYTKEGDYFVTLIAKTGCGNDTFIDRVIVRFSPVAGFAFNTANGCKPLSVSLTDTSSGSGSTRTWTVRDGSTTRTFTDSVLNYTFINPGLNSVSLKVVNSCDSSVLIRNFRVTGKPTAAFSNIPGSCIPMVVDFDNTSTSYFGNPSYSWNFGDGTTSAQKDPAPKTYSTAGNYTVTLIVSDSCGNDTFTQNFIAYDLPVAAMNGDTAGCTFDSLSFNNTSSNSNSFEWDFGDGQTLTASSPGIARHAYSLTGTYTIRLISGTGAGCRDTAYHTVFIRPGAKAQFDIDKTYGCNPVTFRFTNNSIYGKDFRWYANGQLVSTNKDLGDTTLYNDTTVIRLRLIATSASSCQDDSTEKIFFTPKNPEAIINNRDSGCGILRVNFISQSTNAVTHYWDLGNGDTSYSLKPVVNYQVARENDTLYYPSLKVTNWAGCIDSTSTVIKVFPGPEAAFSMDVDKGCGPLAVSFTNLSRTNNSDPFSSLSHAWYFGDADTSGAVDPSHTFNPHPLQDTVYNVSLKTTTINGCYDSVSRSVRVYPLPLVNFAPDRNSGCSVLPVSFYNLSNPRDTGSIAIMSFRWNSGNGASDTMQNFSASYSASLTKDTVYQAKLVGYSEHGCKDSAVMNIIVHPQPVARFTLNRLSGCTPLHISTQNQSLSMDGGPLTHSWDFGNAYRSASEDDSSIYFNATNGDRSFTVTYQAVSQYGCRDTASETIIVRPKPVARFTVSAKKACAPVNLDLSDNSINASQYFWAEGNNRFQGNPNEQIVLSGLSLFDSLYIISHYVVSPYGCVSDTVYEQVQAIARPLAAFDYSHDSACSGENIALINNSLGGFRYQWNFGDNTGSTQINPKHRFMNIKGSGTDTTFNVRLEVTSPAGCRDTVEKPVYLVGKSIDRIVLDKPLGCTDLQVTMSHNSNTFNTLYWDFGDNSATETGDTVRHTYVNPLNTFTMQPKVALHRQRYNCRDTAYATVWVYPKPTADFITQRNDPCDAGIHQLINKSKYNTGNQWTVDSTIYTVSSFSILLPSAVNKDTFYNVKLIVTNNYRCVDSIEKLVKVKPKLKVSFVQQSPVSCEKGMVNFTNTSLNSVRSFWKFGDGGISNEMNPSYIYNKYGTYRIMLYGYDKDGCVDSSDGKNFYTVLEKPKADFSYLPAMPKLPNALVNFTAKPTIITVNEDDLAYEWDFGDSSFPANRNQKNPSHIYTRSGFMNVKLTVWNQQCSDAIIIPVFIEDPKPVVDFTPDTLAGCAPFAVTFRNHTTNVTSYRWIFGDGTPDSYEREPVHVFRHAGQWDVTLIATGTGGTATLTKKYLITTYPQPFVDFYTKTRFLSLPNAVFNLQNISTTVKNDWTIYDSSGNVIQASSLRDPSFYVNQAGYLHVRLIGTNSYGCTDTMTKENYLSTMSEGRVYVPSAFTPNKNGRNDDFKPSLYNVRSGNYIFRIYNRWGEKLFETTDTDASWDGSFKGQPCQQDTYIWTVNGEYINADMFSFRGTVTLLR